MSRDPGTGGARGLEDRTFPCLPALLPRGEAAAADEGDGGQGHAHPEGLSGTPGTHMVSSVGT